MIKIVNNLKEYLILEILENYLKSYFVSDENIKIKNVEIKDATLNINCYVRPITEPELIEITLNVK